MAQPLTIVMYHYVRDFSRTRYPRINGLDVDGFRRQLDHLTTAHTIVRMEDVLETVGHGAELPPDAALLTFDDGYADHFNVVFPILHDRGLQGSFFPPVAPVRDGTLLDVNRVHFTLASAPSSAELAAEIDAEIERTPADNGLRSVAEYRAEWAHPNRFDDAETIYVKRMLQTALPDEFRGAIARRLFEQFVTVDEEAFAGELYLTIDQARLMVDCGMYFGSHGTSHRWLNHLDRPTQVHEIEASMTFLSDLGMSNDDGWVMCYPYGGWNAETLQVLRDRGCSLGLTTRFATALIGDDDPLALPRRDTNDFPQ